jgi:acetyl esterase/lipase
MDDRKIPAGDAASCAGRFRVHGYGAAAMSSVSWQARLQQFGLRRFLRTRLTLEYGVAPVRGTLDRLAKLAPRHPRSVSVAPAELGGVRCERIRPHDSTARGPVLLYFHGGAYLAGSPRLSRPLVWRVAVHCGGEAFSVAYRLAPEHPFPAALDDALRCYDALVTAGCATDRIVVAGDSAGGGLALALAVAIRDGSPRRQSPAGLVLISPWTDLTLSGPSMVTNADIDPVLDVAFAEPARRMYLPAGDFDNHLASPLFARLERLPPVLIQVGSKEILLDDARRLAARLAAAGVTHRLDVFEGMHHLWQLSPIPFPESRRAIAAIVDFVATACRRSASSDNPRS